MVCRHDPSNSYAECAETGYYYNKGKGTCPQSKNLTCYSDIYNGTKFSSNETLSRKSNCTLGMNDNQYCGWRHSQRVFEFGCMELWIR